MSDLLDIITAHYRAGDRRKIEVPEWAREGEKPLTITYMPVTLDDQSHIEKITKGDRHQMAAHLVALKACDAEGKRLFEQMDALTLRQKADPIVVARIAMQMLGGLTLEAARGN
jgi:hypothetical protein